jgi:phosphatidylglycerol lysyltransferase
VRYGAPVGFVNCSPVPARSGWLTEQFIRGKNAPNGTVELLLDFAARAVATEGAQYLTMGLVPLSRNTWDATYINPVWLRWVLTWVRAHGLRFYNFEGLERFKAKFHPHTWETIYAVSNQPCFTPRLLYAIAHAFSHQSPFIAVGQGLSKAVGQEMAWLWEKYLASKQSFLLATKAKMNTYNDTRIRSHAVTRPRS